MITVKDIEPCHIVDVYESQRFERHRPFAEIYKIIKSNERIGTAGAVTDENNKCIFIMGIYRLAPGVGAVWMYGTDLIPKYKISFYKLIHKIIALYVRELKLHRVEFTCRKDIPTTWKFAESLGFKREGLRRQADEFKDDWYIYARLF